MLSAVITGATSKLGVAVVNEFIAHGIKVIALVRGGSRNISRLSESPLLETVECSLDQMKDFVPAGNQRADVFLHFAWGSTDKNIRDNPLPQLANLNHEIDAVNLAKRFGCRKFIGAGSQAEYGAVHETITESTRPDPLSSYGIAKFAGGKLTQKLCSQFGMDCIWPRIFSVYGPGEQEGTLLSYAIRCAMNGEKASFSAATNDWDYLHARDFARYMRFFAENDVPCGVYNIASGETRPLKDFIAELAEVIESETGKKLDYELSKEPVSETTPSLRCDVSKLRNMTAIVPEISFADGIKNLISGEWS